MNRAQLAGMAAPRYPGGRVPPEHLDVLEAVAAHLCDGPAPQRQVLAQCITALTEPDAGGALAAARADADTAREALAATRQSLAAVLAATDARTDGADRSSLIAASGLSRQTVYGVLRAAGRVH